MLQIHSEIQSTVENGFKSRAWSERLSLIGIINYKKNEKLDHNQLKTYKVYEML